MQIVILDGQTTNPGDLSWGPIEAIGPTVVHARTADGLIMERAAALSKAREKLRRAGA